ncbi:alpha/beta hydrolase [Actinoplanes sp. G11-F43]|uniref:alpha/beta hydrolase n=1 Tax=Actinoplanes sp. G11-F43 TaxID=3424130 RepID=UPI003D34C416
MQSPRIAALLDDPAPDAVDRFWAEITRTGTPLIEPYADGRHLVTFLWRGEATAVRAWFNIDIPLVRLPGTDLWHGSGVFPSDLRTIYCLVHDGAEQVPQSRTDTYPATIDQANPRVFHLPADPDDPTDADTWCSVLELPDAPPVTWTGLRPHTPAGRLDDRTLPSLALRTNVRVTAYLPPGIDPAGLPVLVVFDGYPAQTMMRIPTVLDNLIAGHRIPPMAALFVRGRDEHRNRDLTPGRPMERLVADELLPWAQKTWRIGSPGGNLIAGMSRGGLVAAHLGLRRPDLFQAAIAHSGSFWWPSPDAGTPARLVREVARTSPSNVHFFLDVGFLETMTGPGGAPSQLTACRRMRDALTDRGFRVTYQEFQGGHDYVNWRDNFAGALIATTASAVGSPRAG